MTRSRTYTITQDGQTVLWVTVVIPTKDIHKYSDYLWDSRLGVVTAIYKESEKDVGKRVLVPCTGTVAGAIEPKPYIATNISQVDLDYWYY
jgi:hypothetical protein